MAFNSLLNVIRYYTQLDPYFYTVDNRPLEDLAVRDVQLADEIDKRSIAVDITGAAAAVINKAPQGWTVTVNGTGDYTINHGLNDASYVVVGMIQDAAPGMIHLVSKAADSFQVKTTNAAGAATHLRFNLIVSRY